MQQTLKLGLTAAVLLGSWAMATPATGAMHLRLTKSLPAKDSSYTAAPVEIRLWYSQEPLIRLSSVSLTGPHGAVQVERVRQDSTDKKLLVARITGTMHEGDYTIAWRTASSDGHPIRGEIPFSIK